MSQRAKALRARFDVPRCARCGVQCVVGRSSRTESALCALCGRGRRDRLKEVAQGLILGLQLHANLVHGPVAGVQLRINFFELELGL
jgi:hypothetical protein